jgi:hypothetical protein
MVLSYADSVGAVPLRFSISDADCTNASSARHPVFLHIPRTTLLFAVQISVFEAFSHYVPDFGKPPHMMLTFEDRAVPWHYPAGVIFDIAVSRGAAATAPLPLTVRITSTCEDDSCVLTLVPSQADRDATRAAQRKSLSFFSGQMLKASLSLSFGSLRAFFELSTDKTDAFLVHALRETAASRSESDAFVETLHDFRRNFSGDLKATFISVVVHFPHVKSIRFCSSVTRAVPFSETETVQDFVAKLVSEHVANADQIAEPQAVVQGVAVHPATPLLFLFNTFSSSDYRLHIVLTETRHE